MSKRRRERVPGLRQAFRRLMRWAEQDDLLAARDDILEDHFEDLLSTVDGDIEMMIDALGQSLYADLLSHAMEDFLTTPDLLDEGSIVEAYLKRRGWKESAMARRYLRAIRDTPVSLHHVLEARTDGSFVLQDAIFGTDPETASDTTGACSFKTGDYVVGRVLDLGNRHVISDGPLRFHGWIGEVVLRSFETLVAGTAEKLRADDSQELRELADSPIELRFSILALDRCWFSHRWLMAQIDGVPSPSDGSEQEDGELTEVRFPIATDMQAETRRRIAKSDSTEPVDSNGNDAWFLHGHFASNEAVPLAGHPSEDQPRLGMVFVEGDGLILSAPSSERADAGRRLLAFILGGLVGTPEVMTIDQEDAKAVAAA